MSGDYVEFAITDGTVVIDFLAANRGERVGFGLQRYTPGRPQLKDGGVWQDSPLAVGRQLVFGIDTNTADAITLVCGGPDQSFIIRAFAELDKLLDKAQAYWTTTWQQTPVYLRARAKGETSRRYALVHYGKYDEYFDPYGQLFAGGGFKVCTEEFVLGVERGLWTDLLPGQSEDVPITHDGNSGDPITATGDFGDNEGLVVGNIHNAGLTHVYQFTASGSIFSANLLDGSPPYTFLGATQAVGNIAYFGADLPFYALKFELSTLAGASTIAWEYWDGTTWSATTNTSFSFQNAAPHTFRIVGVSGTGWAKTTINSRNKYWIRARVTSVTGSTSPVQANRHIYAVTNNYVEVAEVEAEGTQDALLKLSATLIVANTPVPTYIGLRSYDRGSEFQSNINVGDGNPGGISQTSSAGITINSADGLAPGGVSATATGAVGADGTLRSFYFTEPAISSYFGRFRLFARATPDDIVDGTIWYQATPVNASVVTGVTGAEITGEVKRLPVGAGSFAELIDLGYITLPLSDHMLHTDNYSGFTVSINCQLSGSESVTLLGIVLLPVDEWTAEIDSDVQLGSRTQVYVVDAISHPKYPRRGFTTQTDGNLLSPILISSNGAPVLRANARQRYWFAFGGAGVNAFATAAGIRIAKSQRNLSLRSEI